MTGTETGLTGGPLVPTGAPSGGRGEKARGRRNLQQWRDARFGLALISPTVVVVLVLVVLPILWTIVLAFQDLRLIRLRSAGLFGDYTLDNFVDVFTSPGFWSSLVTTLVYATGGTVAAIGLGLVAALALRAPFRGRTFVRASLLLPYVAPVVAATFVWGVMLNPQFGIVNEVGTGLLGWDEPIAFLSERPWALLTVIVFEMWRSFPFAFLFLTARLQAAPATLEEAARVDGATPTQVFRHVVWPQLLPTIAVLALLRFIWTFNNFDDIYLLTGGGAGTEVISVRVFDYLVSRGDIGAASAQALVLAAVLTVLVTVYYRFAAKDEVA
ncbi:carbohydrate ABC transporter permease [Blastococcus sp. SYSU D00669]